MELPQHGESSRSISPKRMNGQINGDSAIPHDDGPVEKKMSRLILQDWDVPPAKHVHASHDLISLLHLDTLYNTYVRPYADAVGPEDETASGAAGGNGDRDAGGEGGNKNGKGKTKRKRLEKGYTHLIDDCIDPTPMGEKKEHLSIIPLIADMLDPHASVMEIADEVPQILPRNLFDRARIEAGLKQDGYANGSKLGVAEAEEKRRRKREKDRLRLNPPPTSNLPSSALPSPGFTGPVDPSTPLPPIAPPSHLVRPPFPINTTRRGSGPSRGGMPTRGIPPRPGSAGLPPRTPGTPGYPSNRPGTPGYPFMPPGLSLKRPGEHLGGPGNVKRSKQGGSRSATPPVTGNVQRPGIGKTPRSKTEGV